jgi:predicted lipoprotein with Yx(FWY)xxD motif
MKPSLSLLALIAAALTPAMLTAGPAVSSPTTSSGQTPKLALSRSNLGSILVDNRGRTLYLFEKNKRGKSSCDGACATYWPPLLTRGVPDAERGVKQSLLGVTRRASGVTQVTYAGHPLYRFVGDAKPGETSGQNSHAFGADWYVVSSAGKKIEKASR